MFSIFTAIWSALSFVLNSAEVFNFLSGLFGGGAA